MVITIKKDTTPDQIKRKLAKLSGRRRSVNKKKTIKDFYGALRHGIDGLTYQKEMRNED